ncbi:hypothetical protein [Nocardia sp. NPDC127526]|uniref:hypothetical protein n=1 Tax=Nocardia sp. NPDC127526 TaxID=3345393 RepID=UPI0036257DE3
MQRACRLALRRPAVGDAKLALAGQRVAWLAENAPRTPQLVRVMALYQLRAG